MSEGTDSRLQSYRLTGAAYEKSEAALSSICVALTGLDHMTSLNVIAVVLLDVMASLKVPPEQVEMFLSAYFSPLVQQQAKDLEYKADV